MDRRKKRRRDPLEAPISIKSEDDDGTDVIKPSTHAAQASNASFQGLDRASMEAERLARQRKKEANVASAPKTASAANDNHETWSKKWTGIFPRDMIQEVGKRRNPLTLVKPEPTDSTQLCQKASVYFVLHSVTGGKSDGQEAEILGTYTNVASANEHAMVHFAKEYRDYGLGGDYMMRGDCSLEEYSDQSPTSGFPRGREPPDINCACWDTDKDGCLILKVDMGKWGMLRLETLKQPILDEPPAFPSKPKRQVQETRQSSKAMASMSWW